MEDVKGRGNPGLDRAGRVAGKKKKRSENASIHSRGEGLHT